MKKFIFCFLFLSNALVAMQDNVAQAPVQNIPQPNVDAAAQAIHDNQAQGIGRSLFERCSEGIITSLVTQVAIFVLMDIYQGSKGYGYRLLFGPNEKEVQTTLAIEKIKLDNEEQKVKIVDGHARNYKNYKAIMKERIEETSDEKEKAALAQQLKQTTEFYTRKQEERLIGQIAMARARA